VKITKKTLGRIVLVSALVFALSLLPFAAGAYATTITTTLELLTVGPDGTGGDRDSHRPVVSADGSTIVFMSKATDLIDGLTTSGNENVYLYDVATGEITLITTGHDGTGSDISNNYSLAAISADGSKVVFQIVATNLIEGVTTTDTWNVYLYDVESEEITLITTGLGGAGISSTYPWGLDISGDGRKVVFPVLAYDELIDGLVRSDGNRQIVMYDVESQDFTLISAEPGGNPGNSESMTPAISHDGSRIVFGTTATDLIEGQPLSGGSQNAILWDEAEGFTLLTPGPDGTGATAWGRVNPSISADGTQVTFVIGGSNTIPGFVTNGQENIFLWDETAGYTLITAGALGTGGDNRSMGSFISGDGTQVGFVSQSTDLIEGISANGGQNVFLYDVATAQTELITKGSAGLGGNNYSYRPTLSHDGTLLTFHSRATDLIEGQPPNGMHQAYLWQRTTTHEVTFDAQNGSDPSIVEVRHGKNVDEPTQPERTGFVFNGWWTDPVGGVLWDFNTLVRDDMTLYAQWIPLFTVTFDAQNGTAPLVIEATEGSLLAMPTNPTRVGYTFAGWWTDSTGGVLWNFETDTVSADLTLYGHWISDEQPPPPVMPDTGDDTEVPNSLWTLLGLGLAAIVAAIAYWYFKRKKADEDMVEIDEIVEVSDYDVK